MANLYENIRKRREALGMSQNELATKTGYSDRTSISKIESGNVDLTQSRIMAFAKALNITASELMGWDEERSRSDNSPSERKNVVRIAGRDGSYVEKKLSDEQVAALKTLIDQLPEADDL